jgi:predicted transcriptional regulator
MSENKTSYIGEKEKTKRLIRSKLALTGVKQREIANALGISKSVVSLVLSGQAKSRRVADYLKDTYGIDIAAIYADKEA